jgi:hypothetical protein
MTTLDDAISEAAEIIQEMHSKAAAMVSFDRSRSAFTPRASLHVQICDQIGDVMAEPDKGKPVSLQELVVTTVVMADALTKLLIEKVVITDAEFKQKLLEERAVYRPRSARFGTIKRDMARQTVVENRSGRQSS